MRVSLSISGSASYTEGKSCRATQEVEGTHELVDRVGERKAARRRAWSDGVGPGLRTARARDRAHRLAERELGIELVLVD